MKDFIASIIKSIIKWTRTDGMLHSMASALVLLTLASLMPLFFAIILTVAVGVGKEIRDEKTGKGTAEAHDLICDLAGLVYGLVVYILIIL